MPTSERVRRVLVDTNLLLYLTDDQSEFYQPTRLAIEMLTGDGVGPCMTMQNVLEFWAVCMRPRVSGGFEFGHDKAEARLEDLENTFSVLPESAEMYDLWRRILREHEVRGRQVYDARLVAAMHAHGVQTILAKNTKDFRRYASIAAVDPEQAAALLR
jgi:predicted nucleic acid-binding protein